MAESPSHKLGQIVGYTMEQAFYDMLLPVAEEFDLFVDRQGERKPARSGKFVTWMDDHGNKHNLDFVLERGGSASAIGIPAAFIESAWRRYTKHSVNKAGEIANALVPLRRTYVDHRPFLGALVAGDWTQGGITHMESQGISVLHLPIRTITKAFATQEIDLFFDEETPTAYMAAQVRKWDALGDAGREKVIVALREGAAEQFEGFIERVREQLSRKVQSVLILPLYGAAHTASSIAEALAMLSAMEAQTSDIHALGLVRIEIKVHYSDTDKIDASFGKLSEAIMWLEKHYLDA